MNKVRIIADSTCDLSRELIDRYNITIVPLCIVLDEKSYFDGEEITPAEIYAWSDEKKVTPKTAAVPFDRMTEAFKNAAEAGEDIIFFGISSDMSTTCNVARIVAEDEGLDRVFVIDSRNLSTGIGLQVLRAAELAADGKSAEEIVEAINGARDLVRASFVVDDLTFLARGGRCSSFAKTAANILGLHPMIVVRDGKMGATKKYRGKMEKVLVDYVNDMLPSLQNADTRRVFITHSGCEAAIIEVLRAKIEALGLFEEILITQAGGVISSHCGPSTLGVLFYEKN
jgi:DegV family protein with EDD domain